MKKNNLFVLMAFFMLAQLSLFGQEKDIVWVAKRNVEVNANDNTLTAVRIGSWNAGAKSSNWFEENQNGYIKTTVKETNKFRAIGFYTRDTINLIHPHNLDYGLYFRGGNTLYFYENGQEIRTNLTYKTDDVYTIERRDGKIIYFRNDDPEPLREIDAAYTKRSRVYTAIHETGGTFANVKVNFTSDQGASAVIAASPENVYSDTEGATIIRLTEDKYAIGSDSLSCPGNFKLYVENGILSKRVKVAVENSTNWADYVFEKDYERNSLPMVSKYIKKHQHLPNVPSASHVVKEGIDLQEMDATLLRQVEEIWLHLIDMDKKMKKLEKENKNLKQLLIKRAMVPKSPEALIKSLINR